MLNVIKKWTGRLIVFVLIVVVGLYVAVLVTFRLSASKYVRDLTSRAEVVETEKGPIEVLIIGDLSDPAVLVLHGSAGGYDGGELLLTFVQDDELSYIIPSRPGYLRTPLSAGSSPAEQADAYAALFDALGVDQATIFGGSGGTPSALEFARRYPERTSSLVLYAAITGPLPGGFVPTEPKDLTTRIFGRGFQDWAFIQPLVLAPDRMTGFFEAGYADSWPRLLADEELMHVFTAVVFTALPNYPAGLRYEGWRNDAIQFVDLDLGSFEALAVPTLIMHGTGDTNVPFEFSQALSEEIPGAETLWIDQGDHFMLFTRADEIRPVMNGFIKTHTAYAGLTE